MRTSSAKAKGKRLCLYVKNRLLNFFPELKSSDIEIPRGSLKGADLKLSDKALEVLPFSFELKNHEKLNIWAAIEQSKNHVKDSEIIPTVVFSKNHHKPQICMGLDDFLTYIKQLKER